MPGPNVAITPAPSPQEAAALAAALEQFVRDTTVAEASPSGPPAWLHAGLLAGVHRDPGPVGAAARPPAWGR